MVRSLRPGVIGIMPKLVKKLLVANGALLEAPIWEQHFRGSNWLALIDIDASAPGGLGRRFMAKGKGECLFVIEQVGLFDAVEFAADYTTSFGNKRRDRWYGVVTAITDGYLLVEKCDTGAKAVLRAKEARASVHDRASALRAEKEALVERAAKLEAEIVELESSGDEPKASMQDGG